MQILFLYLSAFAGIGGIEKFNRAFMKALEQISQDNSYSLQVISAYDSSADTRYISSSIFKGFNKKKTAFSIESLLSALKADVVILGHINLAPIGIMIKALFPAKKIVLITHGIEIWDKLNAVKTLLLKKADTVLAVSNFTKEKISLVHKVDRQKIRVFANTLDPSFVFPKQFNKPLYLQERYKIRKHNRILLTIARLSYAEKYKGYDKVIEVLPALLEKDPNLLYVIGGKADQQEKERLNKLIEKDGLENNVMILGFIPDHELMDHYLLADLFVMPSKGEGFGIVFIEAMACGLPVIGGNEDGSVDALANGEFGLLVKPGDQMELVRAIEKQLHLSVDKQALQSKVLSRFGAQAYAQQVESLFSELSY